MNRHFPVWSASKLWISLIDCQSGQHQNRKPICWPIGAWARWVALRPGLLRQQHGGRWMTFHRVCVPNISSSPVGFSHRKILSLSGGHLFRPNGEFLLFPWWPNERKNLCFYNLHRPVAGRIQSWQFVAAWGKFNLKVSYLDHFLVARYGATIEYPSTPRPPKSLAAAIFRSRSHGLNNEYTTHPAVLKSLNNE